ncbi:MAG: bifunctional histidinol-phosphatase/imidazoleglycerol-phosphate dehydratase HisB [Microscillaceae bacterium]
MKKILFIDRDGTLILEPPTDFQVDSLEKLTFYPKVFKNLGRICEQLDYTLVMVTNQDGLGTPSFPEENFWPAHQKMMQAFENEGIHFAAVHIDRSFEHENAPTRKPRTGLLTAYLNNPAYDLERSFVIGDRFTDMELAANLGCRAILMQDPSREWHFPKPETEEVVDLISADWDEVFAFLQDLENMHPALERRAKVQRRTLETDIVVDLHLDGEGKYHHQTGLGFFDHMLDQLAKHARLDLSIKVKGDLHIDEHHTIEDTALALGEAFAKALGNKKGIERYGFALLPMDEALAQVALDFSGRPWLVWQVDFQREKVGDFPTEMAFHFFKSFADASRCNLNIQAQGQNDHHLIEVIFKAFARSLRVALRQDPHHRDLPSTKGVL